MTSLTSMCCFTKVGMDGKQQRKYIIVFSENVFIFRNAGLWLTPITRNRYVVFCCNLPSEMDYLHGIVISFGVFFGTLIFNYLQINPFNATGLFLYPLKTENQRFSNVFKGYIKRLVTWNEIRETFFRTLYYNSRFLYLEVASVS